MPDIACIGLGGGSIVRLGRRPVIGPHSVGHQLGRNGRAFGGDVLTATDVSIAAGRIRLGDPGLVSDVGADDVARVDRVIRAMVGDAVDRMKTSAAPVPVILVGGGRHLISGGLPGVREIEIPEHADVANAVGAAFAQVAGEAERHVDYRAVRREDAIESVRREARNEALETGADPETLNDVEIEETPLPYSAGGLTRIRVKVAGDLRIEERR